MFSFIEQLLMILKKMFIEIETMEHINKLSGVMAE